MRLYTKYLFKIFPIRRRKRKKEKATIIFSRMNAEKK
jgi:hypothetical protein